MAKQNNEETIVSEVDIDNLEDIFGTGSASVMTEGGEGKSKGMFDRPGKESKEFFDKTAEEHKQEEEEAAAAEAAAAAEKEKAEGGEAAAAEGAEGAEGGEEGEGAEGEEGGEGGEKPDADKILDIEAKHEGGEDPDKDKGGRPTKIEAVLKQLHEKKLIKPFEGEEDFSKYSEKDLVELFELNAQNNREAMQKDVESSFFQSLTPRMQQAYHYFAQGGQDEVALFQALAASEEMRQIDISTEEGQEWAVRQYYQATNYGNAQEIETEINKLKDRGELEEKAGRFKPKLDQMQESIVQQKLQQQEAANKQKQAQMQGYMDNVYDVLKKEEINGIKLDGSVQNMLYEGLVNPKYPSISGKSTNLLGALLEKYQWVEPNHELVAEVLYLLADPEGYKAKVKETVQKETTAETVRTLKTEASSSKGGGAGVQEEEDDNKHIINREKGGGGIQRRRNMFERKKT